VTFTRSLTTTPFERSSTGRFDACSCKPTPGDLLPSQTQFVCVRDTLGHIALDGTKIDANASKHKALSWAHAGKIEAQLRQEVQTLLALAESSDSAALPDGMDVPAESYGCALRLNWAGFGGLLGHVESFSASEGEAQARAKAEQSQRAMAALTHVIAP
jgi:hypothetical protein